MIERRSHGILPPKPHTIARDAEGRLLHEECLTRAGFDGPYTILYHQHRPHASRSLTTEHGWAIPARKPGPPLLKKRHFLSPRLPRHGWSPMDARIPLLWNDDVVLSVSFPAGADPVYFQNGDADELHFIFQGGGVLRTTMGDLSFAAGDYVYIPRGLTHRFLPEEGVAQHWFVIEGQGGIGLPRQWRNEVGQLRMDAPFSHRDFKHVDGRGPLDEGIRVVVVKRQGAFFGFHHESSPLDVLGWDGAVYPFAFPILNFQPRVGLVHLPPTWHGTFAARGALVCSFVPRPLDFHPDAIPCPYPHASVDCDEVLFYCDGNFTSRRGVGPGSLSFHPAGVPHGPHPGAYEGSIGSKSTNELAVMIDTFKPLWVTEAAAGIEDADYEQSFIA